MMVSSAPIDEAAASGGETKARRSLSLRWRLLLLVAVGVLPLLLFSLGYQFVHYQKDIAATGPQTIALARSMALLVDKELQARVVALETLATAVSLQEGKLDEFRRRAEQIVQTMFPGATIELVTVDGREIVNTALAAGAPAPLRENLASLRQVFATGRPAVSNLYRNTATSVPLVAIDVPVKSADGRVIYDLSMHPRLEIFDEILRGQHLPASWVASVLDRDGVNIARVPNGEKFFGHEAAPSLLGSLRREREG
ncbi:MAG TPA: hypothetical protein VMU42_00915, partial [Candidatus Sulfotelmatobacter sp.]|nr:hypothetical protein [Candidatus Sulfotelmatobacter sp.]